MNSNEYGYRFNEIENGDVFRSTLVRIGDECGDEWRHYWSDSDMVGFYDGYARDGVYLLDTLNPVDSERAMAAYRAEKAGERGADGALDRVAKRITGPEYPDARFVVVGIDRGCDLFVLAYDGDPENKWRDEIEALHCGEVYEIQSETLTHTADDGLVWKQDEPWGDEIYYGENYAREQWEKIYPLTAMPVMASHNED